MKLTEIQDQYKTQTENLKTLQNEKTKLEERLSIRREELAGLKKKLEEKGVNTSDIENEYKTRKKGVEDKLQKFSEDLKTFEKGIQTVKGNIQ